MPSAGCTATPTTTACDTQSSPCTADIDGTMRKWYVQLPDSYDPGAPISGAKCTSTKPDRPVAIWATHGDMDTALPITMAEPISDFVKKL